MDAAVLSLSLFIMTSLPHVADLRSSCCPSGRKVSDLSKRRVNLKSLTHADDSGVLDCVCRATYKSPRVVVGVMRHAENWKLLLKDLPRRDSCNVGRLIKWPVIRHNRIPSAPLIPPGRRRGKAALSSHAFHPPTACDAGQCHRRVGGLASRRDGPCTAEESRPEVAIHLPLETMKLCCSGKRCEARRRLQAELNVAPRQRAQLPAAGVLSHERQEGFTIA